ncbi:hypothetical protein [Yoonia sp. BS5-3]|uniref:Uncharacterized protein n=1 Tax=Yoonia phaeophyticola TaxID=3137369 RepID=A0ABZ2V574_9RHOB
MKYLFCAIATTIGLSSAAAACPSYNQTASETHRVSGPQLFARKSYGVVAGGENYIWNCRHIQPGTDTGAGYFTASPDFSFHLSEMGRYQLVLSVVSECDSALLINTASTNWYYDDDDNGNLDPRIVLTRPLDGRVDVWVGTYDGEYCNARLELETFNR